MRDLKIGCSHLDAEGFGLVAARYYTPIVAREDNHGFAFEVRTEDPLA
jgi:hypothetical protein